MTFLKICCTLRTLFSGRSSYSPKAAIRLSLTIDLLVERYPSTLLSYRSTGASVASSWALEVRVVERVFRGLKGLALSPPNLSLASRELLLTKDRLRERAIYWSK